MPAWMQSAALQQSRFRDDDFLNDLPPTVAATYRSLAQSLPHTRGSRHPSSLPHHAPSTTSSTGVSAAAVTAKTPKATQSNNTLPPPPAARTSPTTRSRIGILGEQPRPTEDGLRSAKEDVAAIATRSNTILLKVTLRGLAGIEVEEAVARRSLEDMASEAHMQSCTLLRSAFGAWRKASAASATDLAQAIEQNHELAAESQRRLERVQYLTRSHDSMKELLAKQSAELLQVATLRQTTGDQVVELNALRVTVGQLKKEVKSLKAQRQTLRVALNEAESEMKSLGQRHVELMQELGVSLQTLVDGPTNSIHPGASESLLMKAAASSSTGPSQKAAEMDALQSTIRDLRLRLAKAEGEGLKRQAAERQLSETQRELQDARTHCDRLRQENDRLNGVAKELGRVQALLHMSERRLGTAMSTTASSLLPSNKQTAANPPLLLFPNQADSSTSSSSANFHSSATPPQDANSMLYLGDPHHSHKNPRTTTHSGSVYDDGTTPGGSMSATSFVNPRLVPPLPYYHPHRDEDLNHHDTSSISSAGSVGSH